MSEFADIYSESKTLSEAERAIIQKGVDFIYGRFTDKVVNYRGIDRAKIPEVAEGRVFTGSQAGKNRLIDNVGGMLSAIKFAGAKANITGPYDIRHLPATRVPIMGLLEENARDSISTKYLEFILRGVDWVNFENEHALYYFPYKVVIK
jgi:protease-4